DTLVLKPATYAEGVLITEGVNIRAEEQSVARVENQTPWLAVGGAALDVRGINFSGAGLFVQNGDTVTVSECSFVIPEKGSGLVATDTKAVKMVHDSFSGAAQSTGVSSYGSQVLITDSFFSGQGTAVSLG